MNPITELYKLTGSDFDDKLYVIITNSRKQLLADFLRNDFDDNPSDLLATLSAAVIAAQKLMCKNANLSEKQQYDFESRIDNSLADATLIIDAVYAKCPSVTSREFLREVTTQLDIPVSFDGEP